MKARVKATGEIVEVRIDYNQNADYIASNGQLYWQRELDFNIDGGKFAENCLNRIKQDIDNNPDYWTRLEHQYAGMAMNALLLTNNIRNGDLEGMRECNTNAMAIAYALVEKYKKEERK